MICKVNKADVQFTSEKNMRKINSMITIGEKDKTDRIQWQGFGTCNIKQQSKDKLAGVFVQLLETSKSSQNPNAWTK